MILNQHSFCILNRNMLGRLGYLKEPLDGKREVTHFVADEDYELWTEED